MIKFIKSLNILISFISMMLIPVGLIMGIWTGLFGLKLSLSAIILFLTCCIIHSIFFKNVLEKCESDE